MPFGYNETTAQEYFPITKKEALHQGFDWRESGDKNYSITLKAEDIPDDIRELNFDILKEVIGCRHKEECNHTCSGLVSRKGTTSSRMAASLVVRT